MPCIRNALLHFVNLISWKRYSRIFALYSNIVNVLYRKREDVGICTRLSHRAIECRSSTPECQLQSNRQCVALSTLWWMRRGKLELFLSIFFPFLNSFLSPNSFEFHMLFLNLWKKSDVFKMRSPFFSVHINEYERFPLEVTSSKESIRQPNWSGHYIIQMLARTLMKTGSTFLIKIFHPSNWIIGEYWFSL